jgi:cobalamin biosynthetic protein CobC
MLSEGSSVRAWTFHGGRLSTAREAYGHPAEAWLDLSTGINPHAWPGAQDIAVDWLGLPDEQELVELARVAAAYFGTEAAHVCALPGSEVGLRLLSHLVPTAGGLHVVPTYRTHSEVVAEGVDFDPARLSDAAAEGRAILIANPNNPDGRVVSPEVLIGLAQRLAGSQGWLVVDEAFADARPEASVVPHVRNGLPLLVLRSFGKFFGLAGLRLGFVVGPPEIIARFRRVLGSWPVSTAAQRIGAAAYRDGAWITDMRITLAAEAAALDAVLARHGFQPVGDCPLFRLIETDDAAALFDRLARQAILTRPFDYNRRWLRLGLPGGAEALDRLDRALAEG